MRDEDGLYKSYGALHIHKTQENLAVRYCTFLSYVFVLPLYFLGVYYSLLNTRFSRMYEYLTIDNGHRLSWGFVNPNVHTETMRYARIG